MRALTGMTWAKLYWRVSDSMSGRSWSLRTRSILVRTRKTGQSSLRTSEKRNSSSVDALRGARFFPLEPVSHRLAFRAGCGAWHPSGPAPGRGIREPRAPPATCGGRAASRACGRRAYRQRRSARRDACLCAPGTSTTPAMRLRVVCGLAVTMATFSPVRALSSVLLPTLGRPRMATNPDFKAVHAPDSIIADFASRALISSAHGEGRRNRTADSAPAANWTTRRRFRSCFRTGRSCATCMNRVPWPYPTDGALTLSARRCAARHRARRASGRGHCA